MRILGFMKKQHRIHILFWIAFVLFLSLIEWLWDKATLPAVSPYEMVYRALVSTIVNIPPKIIFAYYLLYAARPTATRNILYRVAEFFVAAFLCVLLDRLINNYLALPAVYKGAIELGPLFDGRRVLIVVLYMGFSSGLLLSIQSAQYQLRAVAREKELVQQQLETELLFLRNQTHPHFLMNTLNNIYALARKKSDDAPEAVMRLSELLRFMLYESGGQFISLSEEIKVLEDYIGLERIRYDDRLRICFKMTIDSDAYRISPLLLLPFVENAFKHGVSESRFASFINISITAKNSQLDMLVENAKGLGTQDGNTNNIGLKNVERQLQLLYTQYNLAIKNEPNVYTLHLTVNLNSHVKIQLHHSGR